MRSAAAVRERPVLFQGEMVRAILAGRKTQTRRVLKVPPDWNSADLASAWNGRTSPYGAPGDRLWVREAFIRHISIPQLVGYVADGCAATEHWERRAPSIHMPRRFCRIVLEITEVRVERVRDISNADAAAEGVEPASCTSSPCSAAHIHAYAELWEKLNGPRGYGWKSNPWVWVVSFRKLEGPRG